MPNTDFPLEALTGETLSPEKINELSETPPAPTPVEPEPESSPEPSPEPEPEAAIEIDGKKYTPADIKTLQRAADLTEELSGKVQSYEQEESALAIWRKMSDMAQKYPALRDELAQIFGKYADNPELMGPPEESKTTDPEMQARLELLDQIAIERAGQEVNSIIKEFATEYPDIVKMDDQWASETLYKEVLDRFGPGAGPREIRMTIESMIVRGGAVKAAKQQGKQEAVRELAKLPKGTTLVTGSASRRSAEPAPVDWSKKNRSDILGSIVGESIYKE